MIGDICGLDQDAQELRVLWRKARGYHNTFARKFEEMRKTTDFNNYGEDWTFSKWLLVKAGLSETQVVKLLVVYANALAAEEREKLLAEEQERKMQKRKAAREERERQKQEAEARRREKQEEEATRLREKQAAEEARKAEEQRQAKEAKAAGRTARQRVAKRKYADKKKTERQFGSDDPLIQAAARIKTAKIKAEAGRAQWINATIEMAEQMTTARAAFPSNNAFGDWLARNQIDFSRHDREALIHMGNHLDKSRLILERTERHSYWYIWSKEVRPEVEAEGNERLYHVIQTEIFEEFSETEKIRQIVH